MIKELLINKTAKERAQIKSCEICKFDFKGKFSKYGLEIEIISIKEITGGIEILARAWKNDKQLGFGKKGKVEIERFRIFNPPILTPDGTTKTLVNEFGNEYQHNNYKEDPVEAVKKILAHAVFLTGKESNKIIKGKIGSTVSTFFPDANVETTSVDGHAINATDDTFANMRAGTGTAADDSALLITIARLQASATTDVYSDLRRSFFLFDTSSIPDTDPIVSAIFSFVVEAGNVVNTFGLSLSLVASTIASNTAVVASDFQGTNGNTTKFATDITFASITADGVSYNDMALNASGLAAISKTGVTKLGGKIANDADNSAPTWSSTADSFANVNSADNAGTSEDPKLVVTHGSSFKTKIINIF